MSQFNKREKKNILLYILGGAFVGGLIGYLSPKIHHYINLMNESINFNIMLVIIPILFLIAVILYFAAKNQFKDMKKVISNDEDEQYIYSLSKFNKASKNLSNANNLLILSLTLGLATLHTIENNVLIGFGILYILIIILMILTTKLSKEILVASPSFTNSDVELEYGDVKILSKMIDHIDEGERLVMLHAFAVTYQVIVYMLFGTMLILGMYQAVSGENQYLSISLVALTLIISTIYYYKKADEFNK
ncbi:DUF3169 family protein [Macrococcus animalis]|uniref:DUF3169 family protein n=1 Tax=Macrococcus animalis TaxID=3395467 RepID=UPI0039BDFF65